MNPLLNPAALELRDRTEDAGDQTTGRSARVDALPEPDEGDAASLPLVEQQDQIPTVLPEPIEALAGDGAQPSRA